MPLAQPAKPLWLSTAYAGMVVGAFGVFLLIRRHGETLVAQAPTTRLGVPAGTADASDTLFHVLLALVAVLALGRLLARLFAALRQPPVVGEVVAGVLLGPSLLGRLAPGVANYVLPVSIGPFLSVIAQLGVILYMFLVGLDLDVDLIRKRVHRTVATSHASIIAPFLLGSTLALYLYPRLSASDVPFTSFALFMGVAMSITAFPV